MQPREYNIIRPPPVFKETGHADLAKNLFFYMNVYCFMCDYYVALISALVLLKCGNLRITVVG